MSMPARNKRKARSSPESQTQPPSPKHELDMASSSSSTSAADNFSSLFVYQPGYRFVPTDQEIFLCYLNLFSQSIKNPWNNLVVHHANIYESNPEHLSAEYEKGNLKEWFFISERTKMHKGGKRQSRGDNGGYWHATVAAKKINAGQGVVGYKTALAYYVGKQPNGVKTNWLMHEYSLESSLDNKTVDHALCKIYLCSMATKKKKEEEQQQQGARNKRKARSSPELQTQPPSQSLDMPSSSSSTSAADNLFSPFVYPPGYRFVPTDQDLFLHYLKPFSQGNKNPWNNLVVHHVNIYESNPQQLSEEHEKGNLKEWFFISERTKITNKGGKNHKRCDNGGFWKAAGAAKKINVGQGVVGYKTALEHYLGKLENAVKTDWLMHEYSFEHPRDNETMDHALYKIYLSPMGTKKKKAEEEENEKKKKREGVVEQPRNVEYQQPQFRLLPLGLQQSQQNQKAQQPQTEDQNSQLHQLPFPPFWDDFSEMINFQQELVIPGFDYYSTDFIDDLRSLHENGESSNSGLLEEIICEGMKKRYTN